MAYRGLFNCRLGAFTGGFCRRGRPGFLLFTEIDLHPKVLQTKRILLNHKANHSSVVSASPNSKCSVYSGNQERLSLDPDSQTVTVTWKDGSKSRFHSIWLRHNCHCNVCRQEHSTQKLVDPAALSHHITIKDVRMNGNHLEIHWKGEEQHVGQVPLDYLHKHCYESDSLRSRRDAVRLDKPVKALPQVHYSDLIKANSMVLKWLRQINEAGVSLLKDVPTEDKMVQEIAEYIGPVEDLIYGQLFDVKSYPKPINVAYSSVGLDFHMDLIYYESPPGLQFLHCLRFDECVEGGESLFLDVFHVAEEFREKHPDHFSTLLRVPATFQKIHYERDLPVEMKYQRPHIVLNKYDEIVAVNWAPAFEGPLAVKQDDVMPYYAAYEAFAKEIKFSPHVVEYRLKPGDLVTFNNRRILHARKSFELNGGGRHLKGCYLNIDHFKNKVTVFSRLHGEGQPAKRVGNQDWF